MVQLSFVICFFYIIADRTLNVLVPNQVGIISDKLIAGESPYQALIIYWGMRLVHENAGIELIRSLAEIPIEQFSYRQISNAAFRHVMTLDMAFHSTRDSAEVMGTLFRKAKKLVTFSERSYWTLPRL